MQLHTRDLTTGEPTDTLPEDESAERKVELDHRLKLLFDLHLLAEESLPPEVFGAWMTVRDHWRKRWEKEQHEINT